MVASSGPSDDHFVLLGAEHLAPLAVIGLVAAALAAALLRVRSRKSELIVRRTVRWSLAVAALASQVAGQIHLIASGAWTLQESLPLHLCDIAIPVVALALACAAGGPRPADAAAPSRLCGTERVGQTLYELAYFWGVGGTTQALLTPDIDYSFPSLAYIRYFAGHGGILVSIVVLTIGMKMSPRPGSPLRVWLVTNALAVAVILFNAAAGSNYMYLCGPPQHPSLYDYFGPWPWSLLTLEIVGTAILILCYAPFWLARQVSR